MAELKMNQLTGDLTHDEVTELNAAEAMPLIFDEDSPQMTAEMLQEFKKMRNAERNKQTVSLRVSPSTLKKARLYGKGYTSFLSRLLDEAIKDDALVRKCI